jgi:hypothetical protein
LSDIGGDDDKGGVNENESKRPQPPAELSMAEQLQRAVLKPVPKKEEPRMEDLSMAEQLKRAVLKPLPKKESPPPPKQVAGMDVIEEHESENHESVKPGQDLDTAELENSMSQSQRKPLQRSATTQPAKPLRSGLNAQPLERKMSNVDAMQVQLAARLAAIQGPKGKKKNKDSDSENTSSEDED